jgi:hypothetical protein
MTGYSAEQLRENRASLLLVGGIEADRRAFAMSAAGGLTSEPFIEVTEASQLERAFRLHRGVVYVPDVSTIPAVTQRALVRVLRAQEERPKFALGVPLTLDAAVEKGLLTDDLRYWLRAATVDLRKKGR